MTAATDTTANLLQYGLIIASIEDKKNQNDKEQKTTFLPEKWLKLFYNSSFNQFPVASK